MANLNVHGYSVNYDNNSRWGVNYLLNLGYKEAKAFFEKAAINGFVQFDYQNGGYKLVSNGGGIYSLSKKY